MERNGEADLVIYEVAAPGVARISLNRPEKRNAQNARMLYQLDELFQKAAQDDDIRCIILAARGPDFSSGHDLKGGLPDMIETLDGLQPTSMYRGYRQPGAASQYAVEQEVYVELIKRWRNLPKPTIAAVQGKCIAGGLMLAWACDLIVASEDATFVDPVVTFGMPGVEWFAHPFELGIRKAKQHLFTADQWDAREAREFGMVNEVVSRAALESVTLALATKIASKPMFALKTVKEAINRAADMGGLTPSIDAYLPLHHLAHAHNTIIYGYSMDPTHAPRMATVPPKDPDKAG